MLESMIAGTFAAELNTKFRDSPPEAEPVEVELINVQDFGTSRGQTQFSVLFRGPLDRPLAQGTYPFEHERLGAFELFIVPVGVEQDGLRYEAFFNRLAKKE